MIKSIINALSVAISRLRKPSRRGVGWYDSVTGEWRFELIGGRDQIRAAIGIDAFFTQLRIWTLQQKGDR